MRSLPSPSLTLMGSGAKNQLAYLGAFVVHNLFLLIILYVFASLWKTVYAGRFELAGYGLGEMIWYLVITEAIMFGRSELWSTVQQEVKDGTVAYGLVRPVPYPTLVMMRFLGEGAVRLVPMILLGSLVALPMAGAFPAGFAGAASGLVLSAGALVLLAQMEMLVGLAAFAMEDVVPIYWILQKVIFIFGGMFFPLDLYQPRLAAILKCLPFAYVSHHPASTAVTGGRGFAAAAAGQVIWIAVLGLTILAAYRRSIRRIEAQGG
jgi:ABC-2 type transport system permease protein